MATNTLTSRRKRIWPWFLLAVVIVVLVGGSIWGTFGGRDETQRSTVDAPQKLRVESRSGEVEVTGSGDSQVSIERRLEWSTTRPEVTEKREGGTLVLSSQCGGLRIGFFSRCNVSYKLRVPASVELEIDSGSGKVTVRDTSGTIKVRSKSGAVSVRNATGRLDIGTNSGAISASGLGGEAVLRTTSGELNASWASVPRSVDARTRSGDLTLTVPQGQYEVRGADSDADISVPSTAGAPNVIQVGARSGDIRVKHPS